MKSCLPCGTLQKICKMYPFSLKAACWWKTFCARICRPHQAKKFLRRTCTKCADSNHPVHMPSIIQPASVAQLDAPSDWRPGGHWFNPRRGRQHSFVEIDHEIFSTAILSLRLIQEGQLSVSGERMSTVLVNRLED